MCVCVCGLWWLASVNYGARELDNVALKVKFNDEEIS